MFVSGHENPGKNLRAFWGIALGAVAAVLAGTEQFKGHSDRFHCYGFSFDVSSSAGDFRYLQRA